MTKEEIGTVVKLVTGDLLNRIGSKLQDAQDLLRVEAGRVLPQIVEEVMKLAKSKDVEAEVK